MTKECYFHFSLGPVQEFVGKARRLKDYWTGSYLLSYLSEQAMAEVCDNGGHIIFPPYNRDDKDTLSKDGIGSFPNRFQAKVPMNFQPNSCVNKVKRVWEEIADDVWTKYIQPFTLLGRDTRKIWDRQVKGFWYMQWILTDEDNDALLDIRKNWRNYIPTVEPGDKCTLFGNLQEISGYIRSSKKNEREKQDRFWEEMRMKLPPLELKEGERLSAIALIKRLFPRIYNETNKGSRLQESFPSTTYMSAIPWIESVIKKDKSLAIDLLRIAEDLGSTCNEYKSSIQCLDRLAINKDLKKFISLDGNCFYEHTLLNDNLWADGNRAIREKLANSIKKVNKEIGFSADTYYALLSMDGDRMGAILQNHKDKKAEISQSISVFSESVPAIIERNNGKPIYAGGEDVFAILPVNTSIKAAVELNEKYTELFRPIFGSKDIATISGAIIFAHHHAPLNKVYEEIQSLLDDKAKDECGRASLAISTWNTSGPNLVWAMPWETFAEEGNRNLIIELSKAFDKKNIEEGISNTFIYNIQKDFELLGLADAGRDEEYKSEKLLNKDAIIELLVAEYIRSRSKGEKGEGIVITKDSVRSLMEELLKMCTLYYRDDDRKIGSREGFNMDGALLLKFLSRRWHRDE